MQSDFLKISRFVCHIGRKEQASFCRVRARKNRNFFAPGPALRLEGLVGNGGPGKLPGLSLQEGGLPFGPCCDMG